MLIFDWHLWKATVMLNVYNKYSQEPENMELEMVSKYRGKLSLTVSKACKHI